MTKLSCGHIANGDVWLIEYWVWINNLDGEPPLIPARRIGTYCSACKDEIEKSGDLISAELLED